MGIFEKLAARMPVPQSDDVPAGFGTPAGIGSMGGAADVKRTVRTHTGKVPATLVTPVAVTDDQRRIVAMAASVLLRYPGEEYLERLDIVQEQLGELPMAIATDFMAFADWARETGLRGLEEHYVETFDQRRRCSLFLTYYAVGDTRQRGMAILSIGEQLTSLGFELDSDEMPDHLCVMLEALAYTEGEPHARAVEMLASYREGIEVLRAALEQLGSPYSHLIVALCKALPDVDEETAQKYVDLIRTGPPAEMVGIADLPFPTAQPDIH
ncbi:nitrate reductase molybdenum cofactor assembly chaperone [Corynebacterium phoceense]|uniref:nitrate reductase molybdenum cofactor assembly chaperone n=1 Tax=Corynebacterium phoceense TaxID=1686286 RepID=UPI00211C435B|nr:nitrate reductase molybdenum cofactor assembly chaperone [Corynebacterium phoceense]MCQ9333173.1 nitrate reductase molybdenum cofactor assembly chaperone [Corynebacterium phoceense]